MSRSAGLLVSLVAVAVIGFVACDSLSRPAGPTSAPSLLAGGGALNFAMGSPSAATIPWQCLATSGSALPATACPASSMKHAVRFGSAAVGAPLAPTNLMYSTSGTSVTLSWSAPAGTAGSPPSDYFLQAGSATGQSNLANYDTGSTALTVTVTNVPAGTYFVRVVAANSGGLSGPSNEVVITVAGGAAPCGSVPGAPSSLVATVNGQTLTLTWNAPAGGCAPTAFIIQAGSASGLSNLATVNTGSLATTFSASGLGGGTYYVRMLATNGNGSSGPSNEVTFTIGASAPGPCAGPPFAPTGLTQSVSGTTITLSWTGSTGATSYVIQAGSASGRSDLSNSNTGGAATSLSVTAPSGTYYVRVLAQNACGASGASNEVVVTVAGGFRAGTWSYALSVSVPLNATPIMTCVANSSGTTVVNSGGAFSIPFSVACDLCAESGTITGTIGPTGVSGSVTASISGPISGPGACSIQQPTPNPAAMAGTCTSASCTASTGSNLNPNLSFAVSYTLTPP